MGILNDERAIVENISILSSIICKFMECIRVNEENDFKAYTRGIFS